MGTGRNKLSARKVLEATNPGWLLDGGGLYLQIAKRAPTKAGEKSRKPVEAVNKSWCFRYRERITGKRIMLGLGSLLDLSLAEAREKAAELRRMLIDGKDPKAERVRKRAEVKAEAASMITFDQAAGRCIADKRPGWKNEKHAEQWTSTLATYASPIMGSLPVASIDLALVRKVLDPIWTTKNETASRVRQRVESVLAWATVSGFRKGDNPARWRGHLDHLLPKPSKVQTREHFAALPYAEMGDFIVALRTHKGVAALAMEFTILTAARTSEVTGARWEEFDLKKALWTVPPVRMKASKEHIVPLPRRAVEIIQQLAGTKLGPHVFLGAKAGAHLCNMAMAKILRIMQLTDITVHGFRSTFRDWAGEQTNYPRELIEHALAHKLKDKAEAAYARSTMPERRRGLMEDWAAYCSRPSARATNAIPNCLAQ